MESKQLLTLLKMTQELIRLTLKEYEAQDPTQLCTPCTVAAIITSNVYNASSCAFVQVLEGPQGWCLDHFECVVGL